MMQDQTKQTHLPPVMRLGVARWLKENLFSTWFNSLLTVIALALIYFVGKGFLQWVLTEAKWAVIPANLQILMIGTYPIEQAWRVWSCLYLVCFLLGVSAGLWHGLIRQIAGFVGLVGFVFALLPFGFETQLSIAWTLATLGIGFGLAFFVSKSVSWLKQANLAGWVLSFPIIFILLSGNALLAQILITLVIAALSLNYLLRASQTTQIRWFWKLALYGVWLVLLTFVFSWISPLARFLVSPLPPVETIQWGGFLLTLMLAIVGMCLSFPLGVLLALGRRGSLPVVRIFCTLYIELIRGVPLITVLFMAEVMLPLFLPPGIASIDNVVRAMIGFTLFTAAYIAENVRGGLQSINKGQYEAASALGLNGLWTTYLIILPQALRVVIPANVGQFISLFKDTSLVAIVGLLDVIGIGNSVISNPDWLGLVKEVFLFVAVLYFVFSYAMSYISRRIEKALGVGER
jgi:general L-amino acid transport system permease protein